MKVLAMDTSNQALAVAICDGNKVIGDYLSTTKKNHSIALMPVIDRLLKENELVPSDLEKIVVAKGPGSYTGLRIGVTTAKTLAWTLGIGLRAVSSLATLAANSFDFQGYIVPLFDARRDNVYTAVYQWQEGDCTCVVPEKHISMQSWLEELRQLEGDIRFVGEDVAKFSESIIAVFGTSVISTEPRANAVSAVTLARLGMFKEDVEDLEIFVPTYLKRVEAEEKWLETHQEQRESYVQKI